MLGISPVGNAAYYQEVVAADAHDYYTGRGEAEGYWHGSGLATLGLTSGSAVQQEAFVNLLANRSPDDGEQLITGRRLSGRTVPAFDLTFSAPKSVSLLYGMGSPEVGEQVRAAHDAAVHEAMRYLEDEALIARRGRGGAIQLKPEGFLAALFRHRSSREGDPDLHTHAIVANAVNDPDGSGWSAIFSKALYHHAKAAGTVYQAALRAQVVDRLGAEWGVVSEHGQADLAGADRDEIMEFSTRRRQVLEDMRSKGLSSARAAQAAARSTRRPRESGKVAEPELTAEGMHDRWRQQARVMGLDVQGWVAEPGSWRDQVPDHDALIEHLGGAEGLTERATTYSRPELIQAVARLMPAGADLDTIREVADRFLEEVAVRAHAAKLTRSDVLRLKDGRIVGEAVPRWTTPDLLDVESRVLTAAVERRAAAVGLVSEATLAEVLAGRPSIGEDQRAALETLTRGGAGVQLVTGRAGTGKTFLLDAAREAWEASGYRVVGAAVAAQTAQRLQDGSGIPSETLARLLDRIERGDGVPPGTMVVLDEAGMVGSRDLDRLLRAAPDAKVVLVGDDRQLPAIDAGGTFRALADRVGTAELTEDRRLRDPEQRAAALALREGRAAEAIERLEAAGMVTTGPTADDVRVQLVGNWWADRQAGQETLMVTLRVADSRQLNAAARALRRDAGELGDAEVEVRTPKTGERLRFAAGDEVLVVERNYYRHQLLNGDVGRVEAVDVAGRQLQVRLTSGEKAGQLRTIPTEILDAGHVDHAYARTLHKSQGATVDTAHHLGSDATYREAGYVGQTRAREANRWYAVEGAHADVVAALEQSKAQTVALDQLQAPPAADVLADQAAGPDSVGIGALMVPDWRQVLADQRAALEEQAASVAAEAGPTEPDIGPASVGGDQLPGRRSGEDRLPGATSSEPTAPWGAGGSGGTPPDRAAATAAESDPTRSQAPADPVQDWWSLLRDWDRVRGEHDDATRQLRERTTELDGARGRLADLDRGLGRFRRREQIADARDQVDALEGEVTSWTSRIAELAGASAQLAARVDAEQSAREREADLEFDAYDDQADRHDGREHGGPESGPLDRERDGDVVPERIAADAYPASADAASQPRDRGPAPVVRPRPPERGMGIEM